jgi:pimeloyl-ACP methyl ester carboxylesterase
MELMGANDEVIACLSPGQRKLIDEIIDYMNPVSLRSRGVAFDNKGAMPNERIAAVRAPTLIFHARDDTLQLYHNAEFAASTIPGAKLVSFKKGGHLLMSVEQPAIRAATQKQIIECGGEDSPKAR